MQIPSTVRRRRELATRVSDGLLTRRAATAPVTLRTALVPTGRVSMPCPHLATNPTRPLRPLHRPPLQNPRRRKSR